MGIKNLILTRPQSFLSEEVYVKYLMILSLIFSKIDSNFEKITISQHKQVQLAHTSVFTWKIWNNSFEILSPSGYRSSRFLKGFENAGERQWKRYGIDTLLAGNRALTIIDVGANIGEFTFAARKRGIQDVYSFEPDPIAFECLSFNIKENQKNLHKIALCEKPGEVIFYSAPEGADSSLIEPVLGSTALKVTGSRLDDFFRNKKIAIPVLLKMDAEGAEPEVLKGFGEFSRYICWVAIDVGPERHGESTKNEVAEILIAQGFEITMHTEWILHGRKWSTSKLSELNWVQ